MKRLQSHKLRYSLSGGTGGGGSTLGTLSAGTPL